MSWLEIHIFILRHLRVKRCCAELIPGQLHDETLLITIKNL